MQAQGNRSEYINALLHQQRQQQLKIELITALQQDLDDLEYHQEIADWDSTVGDRIDAAG